MSETSEPGDTGTVDPSTVDPGGGVSGEDLDVRDASARPDEQGDEAEAVANGADTTEPGGAGAEAADSEHADTEHADNEDAGDEDAGDEAAVELTDEQIGGAIEALLLMAEEPVAAATLAEAVGAPLERITAVLQALVEFYDTTGRGFELRHVGGGWRYWTRAEHADLIGRWVVSGQVSKLSQASLETLAVVAYLQPVSRARISAVRGVSVDGVIRTLLARDLIEEVGQDEQTGAVLFRTTDYFLERMGLQSLSELPAMAPHLPDAIDLEAELSDLAAPVEELAEPTPAEPADGLAEPAQELADPAEALAERGEAEQSDEEGESEPAADGPAGHNGSGGPEPSQDEPGDELPVGEARTENSEQAMGERTDD